MRILARFSGAVLICLGFATSSSVFAITLEQAVRQTISTNPDVQVDVNERKAREQELKQARAGYHPSADLTAGIGFERSNNSTTRSERGGARELTRRETGLSLRQMLFDGFATESEVERQQARINSTAYLLQGTSEKTASRAAEVYLDVLRRQDILSLTQENLITHQRIFDQIELRLNQGVGRRADRDQAEARLARAESNVVAAENNLRDARSNYLRVIGGLPEALERPLSRPNAIPATLDEAVRLGIANDPTLKSAIADVAATMAQHRAAKHRYFPRFDIELNRTWDDNLDGRDGINHEAAAMLRMRYNLYNGGADVARRKQTAHLINEAAEIRNRTCRQVVESMRLSWDAYEAIAKQLVYLQRHADLSQRTRDAYTQQFNIGQRTLLDVLDSENELFVARRDLIDATVDRQFAEYRILAAMGRLLSSLNIPYPDEAQTVGDFDASTMGHCETRSTEFKKAAQDSAHTVSSHEPPVEPEPERVAPAAPIATAAPVATAAATRVVEQAPSAVVGLRLKPSLNLTMVGGTPTRSAAPMPATRSRLVADAPVRAEPPASADAAISRVDLKTSSSVVVVPAVAAPTRSDDERVLSVLDSWAAAWSSQNAENYLSLYGSAFLPPPGMGRGEWEDSRRERIVKPHYIRVSILDPRIRTWTDGNGGRERAEVTFVQRYESDTYRDEVTKVVRLEAERGEWKIVNEVATN